MWSKTVAPEARVGTRNIIRQRADPHISMNNLSPADTFKKFFSMHMVLLIVRYTNKKPIKTFSDYNRQYPDRKPRT